MENEIDRILNRVKNELDFSLESKYNFESTEEYNLHKKAFIFLKTNEFINLERNQYNISSKGLNVIEQGGWIKYLEFTEQEKKKAEELKNIEFEKSKIDLELAKKMLKEYPKTKITARISIIIAIVLALKELYILIKQ